MRAIVLLLALPACYLEPPVGTLDVTVSSAGAPVSCGSASSCVALLPRSNNVLLTLVPLDAPLTITSITSTMPIEEVALPFELEGTLELIATVEDFADQEIAVDTETSSHVVTIQFAE